MALVVLLLFLIATCAIGASSEGRFFECWWGRHLLVLLLVCPTVPALLAVGLWLLGACRIPLDQLSDVDAAADGAHAGGHTGRRISRGRVVVVVAVAALPMLIALFYWEENERGERSWRKYEREQEALGVRIRLTALEPPPVPDDQNFAAAPFLAALLNYQPGGQSDGAGSPVGVARTLSPSYDAASARFEQGRATHSNSWAAVETDLLAWHAAFLARTSATLAEDTAAKAFRLRYGYVATRSAGTANAASTLDLEPATNTPTRAEAASAVLAALSDCEPILEAVRAASDRPYSRFNLAYDSENPAIIPLPHLAILKQFCQVLKLRASAELALGRTDQAFEDIQFIFRLTDATRTEPILITHLVRIAEQQLAMQPLAEGLARHQWSQPQLRGFEERLCGFDFLADARQALQGERGFGSGLIDYVRRSPDKYRLCQGGLGSGNGQQSQFDWPLALMSIVPSGWFHLEKLNFNRMFQDCLLPAIDVRDHRVSVDQCRKANEQIQALFGGPQPGLVLRHRYFSGLLLAGLSNTARKFAFIQSGTDAAAVACALERYRLAHGQLPESLEALVPEFNRQLPHDVINGQPLKYHRTPDGQYVLYSVGWNETDDGGVLGSKQDGQHVDNTTGDWVWRLPPAL